MGIIWSSNTLFACSFGHIFGATILSSDYLEVLFTRKFVTSILISYLDNNELSTLRKFGELNFMGLGVSAFETIQSKSSKLNMK